MILVSLARVFLFKSYSNNLITDIKSHLGRLRMAIIVIDNTPEVCRHVSVMFCQSNVIREFILFYNALDMIL